MDKSAQRTQLRDRMVKLLQQMGYTYLNDKERDEHYLIEGYGYAPSKSRMESCLKNVNDQETCYAMQKWLANVCLPGILHPETDSNLLRMDIFDWITRGIDCSLKDESGREHWYLSRLANWDNPERNTWHVSTCWRMSTDENVNADVWDIVLCVNEWPIAVVLIDPELTEQVLSSTRPFFSYFPDTTNMLALQTQLCFLSDGKHTYVGTPDTPGNQFAEWTLPYKEPDVMTPLEMLCPKKQIRDTLRIYMSIFSTQVDGIEEAYLARYLASKSMYHALNESIKAIEENIKSDNQAIGHILLNNFYDYYRLIDLLMNWFYLSPFSTNWMMEEIYYPLEIDKDFECIADKTKKGPSIIIANFELTADMCQKLAQYDPEMHILHIINPPRDGESVWGNCLYTDIPERL